MKSRQIPHDLSQYKIVLSLLPRINKKIKVLEFGANEKILKNFLPKNYKYFSSDFPTGVYAKKDYDFIINLNEKKIPLKDNSFNMIICLETLEHIFYPDNVLKEFKRILKKDGFLILSIPNEYNFWLRFKYLFAVNSWKTSPFETISRCKHIHLPRVKDIIQLISKYFTIKKIKYGWFTQAAAKNSKLIFLDKIINILSPIYPSLFCRTVVVLAK